MVRLVLSASLGIVLLASGVSYSARGDDQSNAGPKSEALRAVVVRLRFPSEAKYEEVRRTLEKMNTRRASKLFLHVSKAGEGASAEVMAEPRTPSTRIVDVVKELLDCKITKISIEVKK
jgi:hypothetical protein